VTRALVVVPCYDEASRLPRDAFARFLRETSDVSLLFVDDGSCDATRGVLEGLASEFPSRAQVLALPTNRGKAEAVRAGVLRAFEDSPAFVGYWDADLATPLEAILEFRDVMERRPGLLLVLGARVVLLGRHVERRALRHYLGRVAATVTSLVLGLRVYDTQCGAKLFRATPEVRSLFEERFLAGWLFDVEILARLVRRLGPEAANVLYEQPLVRWSEVGGSKLRTSDYARAALDLLRIWLRYLRRGGVAVAPPPGC
jgi:glycosyltransferase involved in cell wall biosynthesis